MEQSEILKIRKNSLNAVIYRQLNMKNNLKGIIAKRKRQAII